MLVGAGADVNTRSKDGWSAGSTSRWWCSVGKAMRRNKTRDRVLDDGEPVYPPGDAARC